MADRKRDAKPGRKPRPGKPDSPNRPNEAMARLKAKLEREPGKLTDRQLDKLEQADLSDELRRKLQAERKRRRATNPPGPVEPDPGTPTSPPIVTPAGPVANAKGLDDVRAMIRSEAPGRVIVAPPGMRGSIQLDRPVVLRPESMGPAAVLTGEVEIGGGAALLGWCGEQKDLTAVLSGEGARLLACRLTKAASTLVGLHGGRAAEVAYCLIEDGKWGVRCSGEPGDAMIGARVHHNHIRGWPTGKRENAWEGLQLGCEQSHSATVLGALVEWNLFEGISVDTEFLSIKSCGNTVRLNTAVSCQAHLSNRHGLSNRILANWIERCLGISLQDEDGDCAGNVLVGCPHGIRVMGGEVSGAEFRGGKKGHPRAVGWHIWANRGCGVAKYVHEASWGPAGDWSTLPRGTAVGPARKLSAAEVGPGAWRA